MRRPMPLDLCRRLEDLSASALLEQPFKNGMWPECERLTSATSFPIMLDESIWTKEDISRAVKRRGKAHQAQALQAPGNGRFPVALIEHVAAPAWESSTATASRPPSATTWRRSVHLRCDLSTAIEASGFAKVKEHPFPSGLTIFRGKLVDHGLGVNIAALATGRLVAEAVVPHVS